MKDFTKVLKQQQENENNKEEKNFIRETAEKKEVDLNNLNDQEKTVLKFRNDENEIASSYKIPRDLYKMLCGVAKAQRKGMKDILLDAITDYLSKAPEKDFKKGLTYKKDYLD